MTLEQVQAVSNRIGTNDRGAPARTFHLDFSSVKIGDDVTPRAALHYALREGKSSAASDDAVYVAGTARPVLEAAELIRQSARVRRGPNAERLLVKQIEELPSDTVRERWNDAAEALVADWAKRGHPAVAVVHLHGEESPHPHLHVLASARRILKDEQGRPTVDRSRTLWSTRTELRDERRNVAGLINEACRPLVELNGGCLEHTNIHRPALTRVPLAAWHRRKQRERHPAKAAAAQMRARRRDVVARARPPRPPSRRARAEKKLASERKRADEAVAALENRQAGGNEPLQLTEQARAMLEGVCRRADVQLDLDTRAGQDIAFALRHIEEGRVSTGELADIRAAFGRAGSAEHSGDAAPGTAPGRDAGPRREEPPAAVEIGVLEDGRIFVASPFDEGFRLGARKLGGKWSRKDKRWTFGAAEEEHVRALSREAFGTGGTETPETAPPSGRPSMDAEPETERETASILAGDATVDAAEAGAGAADTEPESGSDARQVPTAGETAPQEPPDLNTAGQADLADGDPDPRTAIGPVRIAGCHARRGGAPARLAGGSLRIPTPGRAGRRLARRIPCRRQGQNRAEP